MNMPFAEIKENGYDISISRYEEIEYEEIEYEEIEYEEIEYEEIEYEGIEYEGIEYEKPEVMLDKIVALEDESSPTSKS